VGAQYEVFFILGEVKAGMLTILEVFHTKLFLLNCPALLDIAQVLPLIEVKLEAI